MTPITATRFDLKPLKQRLLLASALLLGAALMLISNTADAAGERWARGRILVQAKAGMSLQNFDRALKRHLAKRSGRRVHGNGAHVVSLPLGVDETTAADLISRDPAVAFAEVDRLVEPDAVTANDPYFGSAWHLAKIGAPDAWSYSTGAGVTIAIIDSGVDGTHPDLSSLMVAGWNFYDGNSNTADVYGHGTKVAGAAAARSNNGLGVASVSWQSKIMPLRVSLPDGTAYLSTIATAITYAADNGARVANISFQSAAGSPTIQNAAQYMKSKGGLVVISAGNTYGFESFAANDSVIAVAATDSADAKASFSSYGAYVDLAAPGVGVYSTVRGGTYGAVSGTSFAAPITGGVIALMMARNPALTPTQIESILKSTAVDLGTSGRDDYFGAGRINAAAAVAAAGGSAPPPPPPPPPPSGGGGSTSATTLSITFPSASQASVAAGATITANWSNISGAASTNWIGLYVPGARDEDHKGIWMYVSCSKTPSVAIATGSCAFPLPSSVPTGTYELRLHAPRSWTQIAKTGTFTITGTTPTGVSGPANLSLNTSSASSGSAVTVSWSGIGSPSATDWIGLYVPGAASSAHNGNWMYVGCSQTAGVARASGNCSFTLPASLPSGTYQFRLHSNGTFTAIATSANIIVTGTSGTTLSAGATSVARGGSVTATWSGITAPSGYDWVGLYLPTAASTEHNSYWMYVSCTKSVVSAKTSGSCSFPIPSNLTPGSYELRLHSNGTWTQIARSGLFTVQ